MRHAALFLASLLVLAGCGEGKKGLLSESLMGQMSALCETGKFDSPGHFEKVAGKLGLSADGGAVFADPYISAGITSSSWVALNSLGVRSTAWVGRFGPGEQPTRLIIKVDSADISVAKATGGSFQTSAYESGVSCVLHAADLTREDGLGLARDYGLSRMNDTWRALSHNGEAMTTSYRRVNFTNEHYWQEIEFMFPVEGETGVTIARRFFNRPAQN